MRLAAYAFAALLTASFAPSAALASSCYAFVEDMRDQGMAVRYAQLGTPSPAQYQAPAVKITYVAHSTFLIETADGVSIATDFFGTAGFDENGEKIIPTVVTMNRAHETHWTAFPDPEIKYVLRGWDHDGKGPANYRLRVQDVTIRNVTTDIRGWGEPEADGNSIFVFEVADLCIGHLGHLHHVLTEEQYGLVGRLDVVMAPVDGTFTLDLPGMIEVLKTFKARVVLPMHAFSTTSMQAFLVGMSDEFAVDLPGTDTITLSFDTLPDQPTVILLARGNPAFDPSLSDD
ncbi:MAG: MBL fold metallo-hydrolase [Pseudomonadota bacterium]